MLEISNFIELNSPEVNLYASKLFCEPKVMPLHLLTVLLCILWQNHNYAVEPNSLPDGVEVTHVNLNDDSCAGLAYPARNIMSIQYHPEASPGPHDSDYGN